MEDYQQRYEEIQKNKKELLEKEKKFNEELELNGYCVEEGSVVKTPLVWAISWNLDFYDYFVGEHGWHKIETSGVSKIKEEDFNYIRKYIQNVPEEIEDRFYNVLDDKLLKFDDYMIFKESMETSSIVVEDERIRIEWLNDFVPDENKFDKGSFIEIKKVLLTQLKKKKTRRYVR